MKNFVELLLLTLVILVTTGWFLIPDYYNYILYVMASLNVVIWVHSIMIKDRLSTCVYSLAIVYNVASFHYSWMLYGYTFFGVLYLIGYPVLESIKETENNDKGQQPYNVEEDELDYEDDDDIEVIDKEDIHINNETKVEFKKVICNNKIIITKYNEGERNRYAVSPAYDVTSKLDSQIEYFALISEALKWVKEDDPEEKSVYSVEIGSTK